MKLIEALEIVRKDTAEGAKPFRVSLVCSFTPAHLQTFLHANLKLARLPIRQERKRQDHNGQSQKSNVRDGVFRARPTRVVLHGQLLNLSVPAG